MKVMTAFYALPAVALLALSSAANAVTVEFSSYNETAAGLDLSVDVSVSGGLATFAFSNDSTGDSSGAAAARIYFESGLVDLGLSNPTISSSGNVNFGTTFIGPTTLPAGALVNWGGEFYAIGANPNPNTNALHVGDSLVVSFDYAGTLDVLVAALIDQGGHARIGMNVLGCVTTGVESPSNCGAITTTAVPVPGALPLLLTALGGLSFVRRRKRAI